MWWVKSSQRRNSPRINTFQQENRGKERNWFGRRRMWFGAQNFATSSLPLPLPLPSYLSHLFIFDSSLSLFIFALSLSIHLPLLQALIYDCMQCASFSEIGWICMSCCAIIRAWPQLSVTWMSWTKRPVVFPSDCFQMNIEMTNWKGLYSYHS